MNLPVVDRAVLVGSLVQIAQLGWTYDSKTDRTVQTDQGIETAGEFGTPLSRKLTRPHQELTSGTAQRPASGRAGRLSPRLRQPPPER